MGGTKRAILIEKIPNNDPRAVAFSKRRHGLYKKATKLCLLSGAQVAILATPVSSNSHVSFYSYGHSSVDYVLSAFLKNKRPKEELGLERWWEDKALVESEESTELKSAIDSVSSMLKDLKALRLEAVEKQRDHEKLVSQGTHQEETLTTEPSPESLCIQNKLLVKSEELIKEELVSHGTYQEKALTLEPSHEGFCIENELLVKREEVKDHEEMKKEELISHGTLQEEPLNLQSSSEDYDDIFLELDNVPMLTKSENPWSSVRALEDEALVFDKDLYEIDKYFGDFDEEQIISMCDYNNNYNDDLSGHFDMCNAELDLDLIVEYEKNYEAY